MELKLVLQRYPLKPTSLLGTAEQGSHRQHRAQGCLPLQSPLGSCNTPTSLRFSSPEALTIPLFWRNTAVLVLPKSLPDILFIVALFQNHLL